MSEHPVECEHPHAVPENLAWDTEWTCPECGKVWRVPKTEYI